MDQARISHIVNRELLLLVLLSLLAFGAFVFTRHMALKERQLDEKIAEIWFERGLQYMSAGQTARAIEAFRKTTANISDNHRYVLALASALIASGDYDQAKKLLLQYRESDPEDPEVNIALARLEVKTGAVQEAIHYYQNALYGRWPADAVEQRRQLRTELVRFLLDHQESNLAYSELLVLQGRTPESAPAHLEIAQLFEEAGNPQRALQEYTEAARIDPTNSDALVGAGETLFHLQRYQDSEQFLKKALEVDPSSQKAQELLTLTQMVQNDDPLALHLSAGERQKRLLEDLDRSMQRLNACLTNTPQKAAVPEMQSLLSEAESLQRQLKSSIHPSDSDAVKAGVALFFNMQQAAASRCGAPPVEDEALLLIGREHAGERP